MYISTEFLLVTFGNPYYATAIVAITNKMTMNLERDVLTKTV